MISEGVGNSISNVKQEKTFLGLKTQDSGNSCFTMSSLSWIGICAVPCLTFGSYVKERRNYRTPAGLHPQTSKDEKVLLPLCVADFYGDKGCDSDAHHAFCIFNVVDCALSPILVPKHATEYGNLGRFTEGVFLASTSQNDAVE